MKSATIALGVWLAVFGGASLSRAQAGAGQPVAAPLAAADHFFEGRTPLADSLTGRAKEEYDAAHLLRGDRDYAGAALKFRRAFELSGDLRLLWNIAACEKNLRHYARALRLLHGYRADAGAQMTAAHRSEVDVLVRALEGFVSRVRVAVDQPDASVFVDDELQGKTPLADPLLVDLGQHQIRVAKPGFADAIITQEMTGGSEIALAIALQRESPAPGGESAPGALSTTPSARLSVTASAGAAIWIDGSRVGEQSWQGELKPGAHTLRVTAPGMLDEQRTLVLQPAGSQTLDITLKERPSKVSPLVWVGAGVLAASALAVGGYFLVRGSSNSAQPYEGSLGKVALPALRH